jgi:hypothetical protein
MRVLIDRPGAFRQWLGTVTDAGEAYRVTEELNSNALLSTPWKMRDILPDLEAKADTRAGQILIERLSTCPMVVTDLPNLESEKLAITANLSFAEVFLEPIYRELVEFAQSAIRKGESREDAFKRLFHEVIGFATEIEIIDQHIGEQVLNDEQHVAWFLEKIAQVSNCSIKIVTKIPFGRSLSQNEKIELIRDYVSNALPRRRMYLDFYMKQPHDRFMSVKLGQGRLIFGLTGGIGAFRNEMSADYCDIENKDLTRYRIFISEARWHPNYGALKLWSESRPNDPLQVRVPSRF